MIPLHDLERGTGIPVVTRVILLANILVWLYVLTLLDRPAALRAFYDRWAFDPAELRSALSAGELALQPLLPLVTHQFLHGGWLHLIGNLLYLWIFGDNVEDRLGSARFLIFYLAAGVFAALGQAVVAPAAMVGASGAIAGVLGAYLVISPTARVRTLVFLGIFITIVTLPAIVVIGEWLLIQVLVGLEMMRLAPHQATENVAYIAHIAGFVAGVVLVRLLRPPGRR
ncbi:MAG: rhomboid family intramembrane serine protease [Chloroflexi bacterium]|nr:rhomboid family intramembrane serine protease [Chloroflexota bacterium]